MSSSDSTLPNSSSAGSINNNTFSLPIILGSSSQFRQSIMRSVLRLPFSTMSADIDEKSVTVDGDLEKRQHEKPELLTTKIAIAKMDQIKKNITVPSLVITSDQVCVFDGIIREKPEDKETVHRWLGEYSVKPATVCTSVIVENTKTNKRVQGFKYASQLFHPIPSSVIDAVCETGVIFTSCGGFLVEEPRFAPYLSTREGTEDEIMGLPAALTLQLLREADAN